MDRIRLLNIQIGNWLGNDDEGLRSWLGQLKNKHLFEIADQGLGNREKFRNPPPEQLDKFPANQLQELVVGSQEGIFLAKHWTPAETKEAPQIFNNLSPADKSALISELPKSELVGTIPIDFGTAIFEEFIAADLLGDANSPDGFYNLLGTFSGRWASRKPAEAAEWVRNLLGNPAKITAAQSVAKVWNCYNPEEARAWVEKFPAEQRASILPN